MGRLFTSRIGHYLILLAVGSLLFLPSLGSHSLWDIDESHNAECAREMMEAGNWRVPTFNFELRPDKPALLYWLVIFAYKLLDVSELAARLPSAVCGLGTVLVTYEIGRRMFDASTGILAGIVLASSIMFCISSHAATPDALLISFTTLTLYLFWHGYQQGSQTWLILIGVTTGLGVLAKGPVGLVLPATAIGVFLIWGRRLRLLWDRRLLLGLLLFALIALPWYLLVAKETQGNFLRGFFLKHNVGRFLNPMEGHSGFILYHPLALLAGFAPWSAFLGLTLWYAVRRPLSVVRCLGVTRGDGQRTTDNGQPYRFLWCWLATWLIFFSLAGTKLPNYMLPAYPALALMTARFLVRWQTGMIQPARFLLVACFGCLALIGVAVGGGLLLASGVFDIESLHGKELPAIAPLASVGLILVAAGVLAWAHLCLQRLSHAVRAVAAACVLFVALIAAFGPRAVDAHKVPRTLGSEIAVHQAERDIDIGCYRYYQPGLVFYTQREVQVCRHDEEAIDLLHSPRQTFLIVPAEHWDRLARQIEHPCKLIARRRDFTTGREIILITNRL